MLISTIYYSIQADAAEKIGNIFMNSATSFFTGSPSFFTPPRYPFEPTDYFFFFFPPPPFDTPSDSAFISPRLDAISCRITLYTLPVFFFFFFFSPAHSSHSDRCSCRLHLFFSTPLQVSFHRLFFDFYPASISTQADYIFPNSADVTLQIKLEKRIYFFPIHSTTTLVGHLLFSTRARYHFMQCHFTLLSGHLSFHRLFIIFSRLADASSGRLHFVPLSFFLPSSVFHIRR